MADRLGANPPPQVPDHVVATYYFAFRSQTLAKAVGEISYHATSGIKNPPIATLLAHFSARPAGVDAFDSTGRIGLLHVAFPLKMMRHPDGHVTSCDLLHTVAGASRYSTCTRTRTHAWSHSRSPDQVHRDLPGPGAIGPIGIRKKTGFALDQPAFGTILKPTARITPDDVEQLVAEVASSPLLMFIKEDEDLYPNLDYSPVAERTRRAIAAIERVKDRRGGLGLVYSPHVTAALIMIVQIVLAVVEAGAFGCDAQRDHITGGDRRDGPRGDAPRACPIPRPSTGITPGSGRSRRASIWLPRVIELAAWLGSMTIDFRQTTPGAAWFTVHPPYGARSGSPRKTRDSLARSPASTPR